MAYALDPKANLYPARFESIGGGCWQGEIICGRDPYLGATASSIDVLNIGVVQPGCDCRRFPRVVELHVTRVRTKSKVLFSSSAELFLTLPTSFETAKVSISSAGKGRRRSMGHCPDM
jgi:hypothetical protein